MNTLLRSAADANMIRRLQRESREGGEVIERLQARPGGEIVRSGAAAGFRCAECEAIGVTTAEESVKVHRMMAEQGQPSDWMPCRHCGQPADRCVCSLAVR